MSESLEERVRRVTAEPIDIVPYDPAWPEHFAAEREHLLTVLPAGIVLRIEHVGSTAVPGLAAKPVIDVLVGVTDLTDVRARVVPLLEAEGYEYFWAPTHGDDGPPFYAFFIKRDPVTGARTHHVHVVEMDFEHWEWVRFRDLLRADPGTADAYVALKRALAARFRTDRVAYTEEKTAFIRGVLDSASAR